MSERYLGIILYGHDWSANGQGFIDYLFMTQGLKHFPSLQWFLADLRHRRRRRHYLWKDENIERLRDEIGRQEVRWLLAAEKDEHGATVWVTFCNHIPWTDAVNYCVTAVPESTVSENKNLLWDLIRINGELASRIGSPYGCAVVGGKNESDIVAFADRFSLEGMPNFDFGSWIKWQHLIDDHVRGAYWGNFISEKHLRKIGGRNELARQPFVARFVDFGEELIFFSVTPDLETALGAKELRRSSNCMLS